MINKIILKNIEDNIKDIEIVKHTTKSGKILRWAVITTDNGYAVVGRPSATVDQANDNVEVGERVAIENSKNEMWPLMGYELATKLKQLEKGRMQFNCNSFLKSNGNREFYDDNGNVVAVHKSSGGSVNSDDKVVVNSQAEEYCFPKEYSIKNDRRTIYTAQGRIIGIPDVLYSQIMNVYIKDYVEWFQNNYEGVRDWVGNIKFYDCDDDLIAHFIRDDM